MRNFALTPSLFVLFLLFNDTLSFSQQTNPPAFGNISPNDFNLPTSSLIDSTTHAVIMADVGDISFIGNKANWLSYVFHQKMRIKLLNKQAFDLATIKIRLHGSNKFADQLDSVQASTYTLEEGKVKEEKLDLKDVFKDTLKTNTIEARFALPALAEGCIIEYSYKITSYHFESLPFWDFQHYSYPCLYNKFETLIPNMLGYLAIRHGQDSFVVNKMEKTKEYYKMASVDVRTEALKHTWVMVNIPPFKTEPFVDHPYNYLDAIEFYLLQTYNGRGITGNIKWSAVNNELLNSDEFGKAITLENTDNVSGAVEKISPGTNSYMVDARRIYSYIRDNYKCDPDDDIYLGSDMYKINKARKGSVEDLNMLLIAMLRQKRINASPVILSTKDYGTNPADYPVLQKMNYVICMMKMAGDTFFLDASRPMLGFGKLPIDCYNGHARIISDHDTGSIFFNPNDIKEQQATTVFITNDEKVKGRMNGKVAVVPGYFESYRIRNEIKKIGESGFFKNMQNPQTGDIQIENPVVDSLKSLDDPVKIRYDFKFTTENNPDILYFSPIISPSYRENPFSADSRNYPIEMPYPVDKFYVLNMEIPEGYAVDELPRSVKVAFNGNEGYFEYLIQSDGTNVQLRSHIKLNSATFAADDYNSLRDFFAYVIKKQAEQIVFKKKK
jgi:hypothetical protein